MRDTTAHLRLLFEAFPDLLAAAQAEHGTQSGAPPRGHTDPDLRRVVETGEAITQLIRPWMTGRIHSACSMQERPSKLGRRRPSRLTPSTGSLLSPISLLGGLLQVIKPRIQIPPHGEQAPDKTEEGQACGREASNGCTYVAPKP